MEIFNEISEVFQYILIGIVILFLALSVYFSFRSRRTQDPKRKGVLTANMNICMGIMLIAIAFIQLVSFSGSTLRNVIGTIFLLIGLFNLVAGIRNRQYMKHYDKNMEQMNKKR